MSSAADRLAAAKGSLESAHSSLSSRDLSDTVKEHLAEMKSAFEASHSALSPRALSAAVKEHLAEMKNAFEASHTSQAKRDLSAAAKEHLAAIKDAYAASHSPLSKRDLSSAADRLAAAKSELEFSSSSNLLRRDFSMGSAAQRLTDAKQALENAVSAVVKRADEDNDKPLEGNPEMPVSNFSKTVMPIIIGLVLFFLFGIAAGVIVYMRRKKNKASESAEHRRKNLDIEDDGADEDYGFELPQNQRVQNVGFGGQQQQQEQQGGRKRTGSLNKGEGRVRGEETRETNSKEFV